MGESIKMRPIKQFARTRFNQAAHGEKSSITRGGVRIQAMRVFAHRTHVYFDGGIYELRLLP